MAKTKPALGFSIWSGAVGEAGGAAGVLAAPWKTGNRMAARMEIEDGDDGDHHQQLDQSKSRGKPVYPSAWGLLFLGAMGVCFDPAAWANGVSGT